MMIHSRDMLTTEVCVWVAVGMMVSELRLIYGNNQINVNVPDFNVYIKIAVDQTTCFRMLIVFFTLSKQVKPDVFFHIKE